MRVTAPRRMRHESATCAASRGGGRDSGWWAVAWCAVMTGYERLVAPVVVVSLLVGAVPARAVSGQAPAQRRARVSAGVSPASTGLVGLGAAPHSGVESAGLTVGSAAVGGDAGQGSRDAEDASALALRSGQRVAIESLTSGTGAGVGNAVGGGVAGDLRLACPGASGGACVPVDTSLVARSAGWWVPRAGLADVAVSDKPAGAAVRVRVGWVACSGLQAAAFGIRTTQRASEGGGFRKQAKAIAADAAVTTLTFGLIRAPLYMARGTRRFRGSTTVSLHSLPDGGSTNQARSNGRHAQELLLEHL